MRVVVTGATGNVGTSLLAALAQDADVEEVVGIARRVPRWSVEKATFRRADVARTELEPLFAGADAVVHLAWAIQPARDQKLMHDINVRGSERVFTAAAAAGVKTLVYASSIGAYSPGPKESTVREDWPTGGITTSFYSRHKATVERLLDNTEARHPHMRVVRLRPALIFKRESATGIRRLFAGPLLPSPLVRPDAIRVVPSHPRLRVQAVHADDVAEAYRRAVRNESARGAFNIAADPVLDGPELARLLNARSVPVPAAVLRRGAQLSFKLRLQPTPEGWVDMALLTPLLDATRARNELGWSPRYTAGEALLELLEGMGQGAGMPTPPLDPATSGPMRLRELLTGLGART
ncbi:MAG: NAD-dependent epimerase/dehydratase family protein [Actinomycetota bacterium]|nr:NAD-dependent epimerase/dehydratase family protein [Actinomycetota bacterium]